MHLVRTEIFWKNIISYVGVPGGKKWSFFGKLWVHTERIIPIYPEHSLVILYQPVNKIIKHFHRALPPSIRKKPQKKQYLSFIDLKGSKLTRCQCVHSLRSRRSFYKAQAVLIKNKSCQINESKANEIIF